MYGIVNKALQEMVCADYGGETWQQILLKADISDEFFLSSEAYPDSTTYSLVGAASAITGLPAEQLLQQFGRYWVLETGQRSYGHLLKAGGENLQDFLINLPNFHARIFLIYPNLQPPEFLCEPNGLQGVRLKYFSHRAGLAPFVVGLLFGLGELFETAVTVNQSKSRATANDFDEFLVAWQ
ncbi:heme NO-binding domain-containing protein [Deefgea piscis]|uniref:Heme NO-binding domain-containing protein n=1 Tax=Deefgea piscis TaxID=2739061 RepID=A0A6M8SYN3_9NEIS|nr:heme NO-binding domain-containing protein [Deefgea piscis]QKJ67709.1 heme NO-binding domain-containing protein [Deefgea piscis]